MPWGRGGGRKCDYPQGTSDKHGLRQRVGLHTASLNPPPAASLHLHMVRAICTLGCPATTLTGDLESDGPLCAHALPGEVYAAGEVGAVVLGSRCESKH